MNRRDVCESRVNKCSVCVIWPYFSDVYFLQKHRHVYTPLTYYCTCLCWTHEHSIRLYLLIMFINNWKTQTSTRQTSPAPKHPQTPEGYYNTVISSTSHVWEQPTRYAQIRVCTHAPRPDPRLYARTVPRSASIHTHRARSASIHTHRAPIRVYIFQYLHRYM